MKLIFTLFFALTLSSVNLYAEGQKEQEIVSDSLHYTTTIYFSKSNGEWIEKSEYLNVGRLLRWVEANNTTQIDIKGWTDKNGKDEFNKALSYKRAKAISNYLLKNGIDPSRITFSGMGVDLNVEDAKARRADVVAYSVKENEVAQEPQPKEEIADQVCNDEEQICNDVEDQVRNDGGEIRNDVEEVSNNVEEEVKQDIASEQQSKAEIADQVRNDECRFKLSYFTLRTNLLYWAGGMMNVGVEYKKPESNFGILVNGGYSLFGDTKWNHNFGGWFVAPEVRYYLPSNEQWFVGAQFLAGGYNIKLSDIGRQGTVIGGGAVGGYKLTLSNTFDMDFTLGLGYGHLKYDTYSHNKATGTNTLINKDVTKNTLIPIQAGVNLIWKIK